jgi:hypothetical protein
MLKPVYFPFTYLGDRAAAALRAHFDSIMLLWPFAEGLPPGMRELEECGFLEVLAPVPGDEGPGGAAAVRQFQEWARRHAGGAGVTAASWQARLAGDPMSGDRSAFQLASQIKHRSTLEGSLPASDPLLTARVFLRLAQELDQQEEEVLRDWVRHQARSAELMETMTGRPGPSFSGRAPMDGLPPTGREEHRLPERLSAWARLFLARACPSPVLVTTSAAAVGPLLEASGAARRLPMAVESPTRSAVALMEALAGWVEAPEARIETLPFAGSGEDPVPDREDFRVYLLPAVDPCRLLSRFAAKDTHAKTTDPNTHPWDHTILAVVPPYRGRSEDR